MSAQIIRFGNSTAARAADVIVPRREVARDTQAKISEIVCEAATVTAKNQRLRLARRQEWWKADAVTGYWHALFRFHDAVSIAARYGLREACSQASTLNNESRWRALDSYREAVRRQIFTAAPHIAAVNWKRAHLSDGLFAGAKMERMQQVIADDVAFLKSHPTRKARAGSSAS